jgi:hypothetical protein
MLWPISIIFWRSQLTTVPLVSRVIYHLLGFVFGYVNLAIPLLFFRRYQLEDQERIGLITREGRYQKMKELNLWHSDQEIDERAILEQREGEGGDGDVEAGSKKENRMKGEAMDSHPMGCPSSTPNRQIDTSLLGIKEVNGHCSPDSAWIVIDGSIYDITPFLSRHPGGREILLEYLGQDATKAFHSVGHSSKAKKMLDPLRIGKLLNHSYSQSNDLRDPSHILAGDLTKPHEVGKIYYDTDDPIAISYAFHFFFFVFTSALCREVILATLMRDPRETSAHQLVLQDKYLAMNRMEVYRVETSFGQLFGASISGVATLLFFAVVWALLLNAFHFNLKLVFESLPTWVSVGTSFRSSLVFSSLSSLKTHLTALTLVGYLTVEWMIFSCGISSPHSSSTALRAIRLSLLFTFGLELMLRKIFFSSPDPEVNSPFPNALQNLAYNHGPYLAILFSTSVELFHLLQRNNHLFELDLQSFPLLSSSSSDQLFPELVVLLVTILLAALLRSLFARFVSWLIPSISILKTPASTSELFHSVLSVLIVASFYSLLMAWLLSSGRDLDEPVYRKPSLWHLSSVLSGEGSALGEGHTLLVLISASSLLLACSLLSFADLVKWSTPHFATQLTCLLPAVMLWFFAPPIGSLWAYISPLLLLLALCCLSLEGHVTLTVAAMKAERSNSPVSCPLWIHSAKQMENLVRHLVAHFIHVLLTRRLADLSSLIAPNTQVALLSLLPLITRIRNIGRLLGLSWILVRIATTAWLTRSTAHHRRSPVSFNAMSGGLSCSTGNLPAALTDPPSSLSRPQLHRQLRDRFLCHGRLHPEDDEISRRRP